MFALFQCEVSRAEFDQKQKVKEIIKTQMAEVREAAQQVRGQGQQRPGSGKGGQNSVRRIYTLG